MKQKQILILLVSIVALTGMIAWEASIYLGPSKDPPQPAGEDFITTRFIMPQQPTGEFPTKTVREAWDVVKPEELVLGVTVGQESRAYPLNGLNERPNFKILNDTLGGRPIAATFCDMCHNGIVYSREMDGQILTLAVDGRLWKDSMVMYDEETNTRWSHLSGVAQIGELKGRVLTKLPSVMTDWNSWRSQHPAGTVVLLPHAREEFVRKIYADLKEFVLGIDSAGAAKSWNFDNLSRTPVVNDEWDGQPIVVVFDRPSVTARLFSRTLEGRVLTFAEDKGKLKDLETGSIWEPTTGLAKAGPMQNRRLAAIAGAMISKRDKWNNFHSKNAIGNH